MSRVDFKGYVVRNIDFNNNMNSDMQLDLENRFSYGVRYIEEVSQCIGELTVEVRDKGDNGIFHIKVVIEGGFSYDKSAEKESIHKDTCRELYPYARTLVSNLTSNAGLPPLNIPSIDTDAMEVVEGENMGS